MPRGKKKEDEQPKLPELVQIPEPKPIRKTKIRVVTEPEVRETEAVTEVKVPEKKARKVIVKKSRPSEVKSQVNEVITTPEPSTTKTRTRKTAIPEEPMVAPKTRAKAEPRPTVEVVAKSVQRKPITKKPKPVIVKIEKPAPEKKLTKKQIEKQIEQEKIDASVPQQAPKKTEKLMVESTPSTRRSDDKYLSIKENANIDERKLMTDRIQKNEVVFSHYAIDNEYGTHYYRVLTKK
jgi:hypothetical protein